MSRRRPARGPVSLLIAALVLAACTGDDGPVVETAEVTSGEVVQTVAASARLAPASTTTVVAPYGAEVQELLVGDGDQVAAGTPLLRLATDPIDAQIEQAEQAVAAAEELGAASLGAGFDLAPVLGAFRTQLDSVVPDLIGTLEATVTGTEAALSGAIAGVTATAEAADRAARTLTAAVEGIDLDRLEGLNELAELAEVEGIDLDALAELQDTIAAETAPPDLDGVVVGLVQAQRAAHQARGQLGATRTSFAGASRELADVEAELAASAAATEQAQRAAIDAQVAQAEQLLEAAQARLDERTVVAPATGTVELVRDGGGAGSGAGLDDLLGGGLGALGDLGAAGGELGGLLDGLGAGAAPGGAAPAGVAPGAVREGPVTVGATVAAGEPLLRIYDLSRFTAELEIDELDVVEVAVGQPVTLGLDALPQLTLSGSIARVALSPGRDATGGALYGVSVALDSVEPDAGLRIGLSAAAEVEVRRVEADTVVPTSALLRRGGQEVVFVVRDGIAREIPVSVAAIGDLDAAIDGDVAVGDTVVTVGVELVEDGDEVAP